MAVKIGNLVWRPLRMRGEVWHWDAAVVTARRGSKVIVTSYGHEYEYEASDLRPRSKGRPTGKPQVSPEAKARAWGR